MRTIFILISLIVCASEMCSQTQIGKVKTKGRRINGTIVKGQGLSGAKVDILNQTSVKSNSKGNFSFPALDKTYVVQNVQKQGYQLVDADVIKRPHPRSVDTLFLVMETPENQQHDKLNAERKLRRTLQKKLEQKESEIDEMRIGQREKDSLLALLYSKHQLNEKLISEMAERYAKMDYDQTDSVNQIISDCILNGDLFRAKQLLQAKGNLLDRIAKVKREKQIQAEEETELARRQTNLAISKDGTKVAMEDISQDCLNRYKLYILENQHDSAAYYIELRADLDSTNIDWQYDAGYYSQNQNNSKSAEQYYLRISKICEDRQRKGDINIFHIKLEALYNLANIYISTNKFKESEDLLLECVDICEQLDNNCPHSYDYELALTLNCLSDLYSVTLRTDESLQKYKETISLLYNSISDHRCLSLFVDAVKKCPWDMFDDLTDKTNKIYQQLLSHKIMIPDDEVAKILIGLANFNSRGRNGFIYKSEENKNILQQCKTMYEEAVSIYRTLTKKEPLYKPCLAYSISSLAFFLSDTERTGWTKSENCELLLREAYSMYKELLDDNPNAYKPAIADLARGIGFACLKDTLKYGESEIFYQQSIGLYHELCKKDSVVYERDLAGAKSGLALLYQEEKRFSDSEKLFEEALTTFENLSRSTPQPYLLHTAETIERILYLYDDWGFHFEERKKCINKICDIYKRLESLTGESAYRDKVLSFCEQYEELLLAQGKFQEAFDCFENNWKYYSDSSSLQGKGLKEEGVLQSEYWGKRSYYEILLKRYSQSEQSARKALSMAPSEDWIVSNLAAAILFQGKFPEAKDIYLEYKNNQALKFMFMKDFKDFEKYGVIPADYIPNVEKIKQLLEE